MIYYPYGFANIGRNCHNFDLEMVRFSGDGGPLLIRLVSSAVFPE